MVNKTQKKRHVGHKKTIKRAPLEKKRSYTDQEMGEICSTGQYSTYQGNFYKNPNNLAQFADIKAKFQKDPKYKKYKTQSERYTKFLTDNFKAGEIPKVMEQVKNDFYGYANAQWLKEHDIEKGKKNYYVQYDTFRIMQEKVYYNLIGYVKKYIKENPHSKKAIAVSNVYKSLSNDTRKSMFKHVESVTDKVNTFIANDDMYGLLAAVNQTETISWCSPIQWIMIPDEKNVKQYISHLNTGQLGIYDNAIYDGPMDYDDNETKNYKKLVKKEYLNYINEVFKACVGPNHKHKPEDIWEVENEMLTASYCEEGIKINDDFYNKVSAQELETKYDFDWHAFTKKMGYKVTPKHVVIGELNGFKCMVRLLKEKWKSTAWQTYWLFIQFKQYIRFEDSLRHIHYNFYNKFLEGQEAPMPSEIYPVFALSLMFNTFLSEQYLQYNNNPLYINYVKHMVDDLKEAFIQKISVNSWLSPSTKKAALNKLKKLSITVGKPDNLRYDPLFDYKADDPLHNVGLLLEWKHKRNVLLEGKPIIDVPEFDWNSFKLAGTQCYVVNAFYRPDSNSIYIPMAYLQKPFIDLEERGLEYNAVYIGYTLGHELSHSLDESGSKFDADGNLNDWWTEADKKVFKKKMNDIVKQYEVFAARDGIKFDAEISIGEDLADISGLALIEAYILDNQIVNDEPLKMKKMNLAKMYLNFAYQARQKITKKAIKAQLKMNPHPLEKYRTNCVLARSELFKTIYGIKKGDGMYWNSDTIW
jgi:predicted metalloendopeptidase